jgi:hypothetical protein
MADVCFLVYSLRGLFSEEVDDDSPHQHTIEQFCMHVSGQWQREARLVQAAAAGFIDTRREQVAALVRSALPTCSPQEVELIVTHDDGMHVHKLITAVNNVSRRGSDMHDIADN